MIPYSWFGSSLMAEVGNLILVAFRTLMPSSLGMSFGTSFGSSAGFDSGRGSAGVTASELMEAGGLDSLMILLGFSSWIFLVSSSP